MELASRTVLVTGADGFIGSHLVEQLLEEGCHVRALVHYNSGGTRGWLDSLSSEQQRAVEVVSGDVRDPHGMLRTLEGVEVVFHLAALIGIPYSYHSPDSYVDTNVKGTLNVLQAARALGTPKVLMTSTSEVYGTARYVPMDEQHPRQGQSPYAATKIGADALAESFFRSFELPVTIVRPFNTYGPRQSTRAIIPTVITQLLSGAPEIKVGSLSPTRDLVYVADTVRGFIEIARSDALTGEAVNLATQQETSMGALVQHLVRLINPAATVAEDPLRTRPTRSEVHRLLGAHDKVQRHTAWKPHYSLEEGLARTIDWFRQHDPTGPSHHRYHV